MVGHFEGRGGRISNSDWEEFQRFRVQEQFKKELEVQRLEVARLHREAQLLEENNRLQAVLAAQIQPQPPPLMRYGMPSVRNPYANTFHGKSCIIS